MKDKSPCMNCTLREIGCHGRCDLYIAFSEEQKKRNEDIRKKNLFIMQLRKCTRNRKQDTTGITEEM